MKTEFTQYLEKQHLKKETITNYNTRLKRIQKLHSNIDTLSLEDLYQFKNQLKEQGFSLATIKQYFLVLKYYYRFKERKDNPALLIKFQKRQQTLPTNLLTEHELYDLYSSFQANRILEIRNKVMLGIMVFQGLKRAEIEHLELHHIEPDKGIIYVPSTTQTNARTVELHPMQMQFLLKYLYEVRALLLTETKKQTNRLFFSMGTGITINNVLQHSIHEMRKTHSYFKSLIQIRESRISLWLKEFGIRKSQYLCGMKYASSMMRYVTKDVEKLRQKLVLVHPMERLINIGN